MRVLVAGASGFIGKALISRLDETGHQVRRLVRHETTYADEYTWDPPAGRIDKKALEGVDAVVNLAGAPLFPARWSAARKQVLLDSRVETTEVLAEAVAEHKIPVLVNASAVGYYGNAGSEPIDESAPQGAGFLAELVAAWEGATKPAKKANTRVVNIRSGLVVDGKGGLLATLKPLFWSGLGAKLGNGQQYMPWISLTDEVSAIIFALTNTQLSGPINATSPNPVTNIEFTKEFGKALKRPAPWRVPAPALKLLIGQAAEEMALFGQRAMPTALERTGFTFAHSDLPSALAAAL